MIRNKNVDVIYFTTTDTFEMYPGEGESREFYWLTKAERECNGNIKSHIKGMALKALKILN